MKELDIARRKEAYRWIWALIGSSILFNDQPINSDRRLAETLAVK
jgi:hypothetical protein